jgi:twitching motility protein PilJ
MTLKLPTFKSPFAGASKKSTKSKSQPNDEHNFSATMIAESVVAAEPQPVAQSTMMNPPTITGSTTSAEMVTSLSKLKESRLPIIGGFEIKDQKRILAGGITLFSAMALFMLWIDNRSQLNAAKNTELIATAMIDTQRMAKEVSAAAADNSKAQGVFNRAREEVVTSISALSGEDGHLGVQPEERPALDVVKATWAKIAEGAEALGKSDKNTALLTQMMDDTFSSLARSRIALEKVSDARARAGGKANEVAAHRQMIGYLQSMESTVRRLVDGELVDSDAVNKLSVARIEFGRMVQAMTAGTDPFAVKGEANGEGFAALVGENAKLAKSVEASVPMLKGRTQGDPRAVQDNADQLMRDLTSLKQFHSSATAPGSFNYVLASFFGLFALLGIWGMSRVNVDESRRLAKRAEQQRAEAERLEQEAKRQNEMNQAAILRLMNELQEVADGDLTVQVTVSEDITGAIADSVNYTVEELRSLVARINSTAGRVGDASGRAQQISSSLLTASEQQSREIRETGESVLRLADSINKVSSSALESAKVARHSLDAAEQGADAVHKTIAGMNDMREQIQDTSKRIKRLGESSQEIGEIVELISDITEQTNVLALNAAIQAASAGEAGRGFTVVAEEVQRLAERSAEATKQISALIQTIQSDTKDAVAAMERSTQNVVEGARLSDAAGQALGEIGTVSRQLAELIESISVTTNREAASAGTVAQSIQRILLVTEQTSDGTQLTAGSIGQLSELAQDLRNSVTRFKVA